MTVSDDIIARFPEFAEFLNIPEIKGLVEMAAAGGLSQTQFQAKLWGTDWWKSTPQTARNWAAMKMNDPATAGQTAGNMSAKVHALGLNLGLPMTPADIAYFSEVAIGQGWTDQTLQQKMVQWSAGKKLLPGQIQATQTQLLKVADDYGANIGWGTAQKWAAGIADGSRTAEGFTAYARDTALKQYPQFTDQLMRGVTMREIADPYMQTASQTLGIDAATMKVTDPRWMAALQQRDAKGNITGAMNMLDWQRKIMTDKAYNYDHTANAQQAALEMRDNLAKTMGITA